MYKLENFPPSIPVVEVWIITSRLCKVLFISLSNLKTAHISGESCDDSIISAEHHLTFFSRRLLSNQYSVEVTVILYGRYYLAKNSWIPTVKEFMVFLSRKTFLGNATQTYQFEDWRVLRRTMISGDFTWQCSWHRLSSPLFVPSK